MNKKTKIIRIFLYFLAVIFIFLIVAFPQKAFDGAVKGINISLNSLLPSLFPFMFVSIFLTRSGLAEKIFYYPSLFLSKLFKKNKNIYTIFFIGAIGGYVSAAKAITTYHQRKLINDKTAQILLCCCTNAGPAFLISAIGSSMFFSTSLGVVLYISSVLTSVTMLVIYSKDIENSSLNIKSQNISYANAFVLSVKNTCSTMSIICSCVIIFSVLAAFFPKGANNIFGFLLGLLEVTSGIISFSNELNLWNILAVSFMSGFCGICIVMQIVSVFAEAKLSAKGFLSSRFLSASLNSIYTLILINVIPISSTQTFTHNTSSALAQKSLSVYSSILLFLCCILLPLYLSRVKNQKNF